MLQKILNSTKLWIKDYGCGMIVWAILMIASVGCGMVVGAMLSLLIFLGSI